MLNTTQIKSKLWKVCCTCAFRYLFFFFSRNKQKTAITLTEISLVFWEAEKFLKVCIHHLQGPLYSGAHRGGAVV